MSEWFSLLALILGDVVWYEDVPNLQLDLLGLGVPDMDAGDEVN